MEPKLIIKEATEGSKRGPYKPRETVADGVKGLLSVASYKTFKDKRYFKLTNGNLLLEIWKDVYKWYAERVDPKERRDALAETAPSTMLVLATAKEGVLY